ncbi:MAG: AI-2E family transporter [Methanosarcinales archaeon]
MASEDGLSVIIRYKVEIGITAAIIILFVLFFFVLSPLLDGIVLGVVFAYVARPIKTFFDTRFRRISTWIATLLIILPIFMILGLGLIEIGNKIVWGIRHRDELVAQLNMVSQNIGVPGVIQDQIHSALVNLTGSLLPFLSQMPLFEYTKMMGLICVNIVISAVVCFYLLSDGEVLVNRALALIPRERLNTTTRFLSELDKILTAVYIGNLYTAIVVAVISIFVFILFDLPSVLALSALIFLAALVPLFTGWMILVPLALYRYFTIGATEALVFLVVASITIYAPPELFIRPYIIGARSGIHPLLIILTFIGGGLVGGISGFFLAPMLLGILIAAYRVYITEKIHETETVEKRPV